MKLTLMGGKVETMESNMVGVDDGVCKSKMFLFFPLFYFLWFFYETLFSYEIVYLSLISNLIISSHLKAMNFINSI